MANIEVTQSSTKTKAGVKRLPVKSMRIDMTPMVDLGFLLITFFVFTSQLAQPTTIDIAMPTDEVVKKPIDIGESYVMSIIPDGEKIYYYEGFFEKSKSENRIQKISVEDLRRLIIEKQKKLDNIAIYKEGRAGLMLLLKPTNNANYKSVVDALDECTIGQVKKYAILKLSAEETKWVNER